MIPGVPAAPLLKSAVDGNTDDAAFVGSPMKKQRASLAGPDAELIKRRLGSAMTGNIGEILGSAGEAEAQSNNSIGDQGMHHFGGAIIKKENEDEEL